MPTVTEEFLLQMLQACAECAPAPLYPAQFARARNLDREQLDVGLDELRRRGLVKLTDWVKDLGQGRALTEAGAHALKTRRLIPAPVARAPEDASADETGADARGETVRRAIFTPHTAWVTRGLMIACIAYFIVDQLHASALQDVPHAASKSLQDLGALGPRLVFGNGEQRPQYERIVLFFFLHIGLIHIFMNMYFLGSLGPQIEAMWGGTRYLIIYLIAGIVSGCVVLLLVEPGSVTAGASGSLFGIFVAMAVWFAFNHPHLPANLIQGWSRNLGINVILLVAINFVPGISWQGHFGGAVGGLLAALLLHVQRFHPVRAVRILALCGVPLIPIGFFVAVLWQAGRF